MYSINDIQIFITTHNRADLIKETIESVLNQTANVKEITVLDNESIDNTEEVVKSYADRGVKYIKTYGFLGNFNKAKEIADREFVMLFHDDDILHPDYLRNALNIINSEKNLSAVYTRYKKFIDDDSPKIFPKLEKSYHIFKTKKDFAKYMYFQEYIAYASAIYRTAYFKQTDLEYEKYNKYNDWPFMLKFSGYGNIALFNDCNAYYLRVHKNQDSNTLQNVPSLEQIVNWDKIFYDYMFEKKDDFLEKIYTMKSNYFIEGKFNLYAKYLNDNNYTLENLKNIANQNGLKPQIKTEPIYEKFDKFQQFAYLKNRNFKQIKQTIKHCTIFMLVFIIENLKMRIKNA